MSDSKQAITPIIVGLVIAVIGILTGFYIADNAWAQLAAARSVEAGVDAAPQEAAPTAESYATQPGYIDDMVDSLPPLEPIVVDDVLPEMEEEEQETEDPVEASEDLPSKEPTPAEVEEDGEASSADVYTNDVEETEE